MSEISREGWVSLAVLALLPLAALIAHLSGESYIVNLLTRMSILGLAGIGLNFALGYGGMVSFGHAAFLALEPMSPVSPPFIPSMTACLPACHWPLAAPIRCR